MKIARHKIYRVSASSIRLLFNAVSAVSPPPSACARRSIFICHKCRIVTDFRGAIVVVFAILSSFCHHSFRSAVRMQLFCLSKYNFQRFFSLLTPVDCFVGLKCEPRESLMRRFFIYLFSMLPLSWFFVVFFSFWLGLRFDCRACILIKRFVYTDSNWQWHVSVWEGETFFLITKTDK